MTTNNFMKAVLPVAGDIVKDVIMNKMSNGENNNTEKTKQLIAGIVIYMGVNLLMYCNEIIIAIDNGKAFLKTSDFPILIIGIIVNFGPAILYLVGARRNRPAGEQIKVENR